MDQNRDSYRGAIIGLLLTVVLVAIVEWARKDRSGIVRVPAAVNKDGIFDMNPLQDGLLQTESVRQLLGHSEVLVADNKLKIKLGHFVARDDSGQQAGVCEVYDRVILKFESDGIAIGGDRPSLEVNGPCQAHATLKEMQPLTVPYQDILNQPTADGEFQLSSGEGTRFKVSLLPSQWPRDWTLTEIRLEREDGMRASLKFDRRAIYKAEVKPLLMSW